MLCTRTKHKPKHTACLRENKEECSSPIGVGAKNTKIENKVNDIDNNDLNINLQFYQVFKIILELGTIYEVKKI